MKKICLFLISLFVCISVKALEPLELNSKYAYAYNATLDKTLYELNSDEEVKIGGITKLMTAIIVIEKNEDLDKVVKITKEDLRDSIYASTGLKVGNELTVRDLLYGTILSSGADSVNALVRITANSEKEFIELMNEKANTLGLKHTKFSNTIGKDLDNYSSAKDIGILMNYCLKNETFKEIISTSSYYIDSLKMQVKGPLYNLDETYNIGIGQIKGGKNGYTDKSKYCLVTYSEKDDMTYIVVTHFAGTFKDSIKDNISLYNYVNKHYKYIDYDISLSIKIENGVDNKYIVNTSVPVYLPIDYDESLLTYKYDGIEKITKDIKKGSNLGKILVYYDGKLQKEIDLDLSKEIKYKSTGANRILVFLLIISIIVVIVLLVRYIYLKKKSKKIEKEDNYYFKQIEILKNTLDPSLFFSTLKKLKNIDRLAFEHEFIVRCFESINTESEQSLKDLFIKLRLFKEDMSEETRNYAGETFKHYASKISKKDV